MAPIPRSSTASWTNRCRLPRSFAIPSRRSTAWNPMLIRCCRCPALGASAAAQPAWNQSGGDAGAASLDKGSDLLEASCAEFHELLVREAGKTISDAIAEVREAVDFCRYYAVQARAQFSPPTRL